MLCFSKILHAPTRRRPVIAAAALAAVLGAWAPASHAAAPVGYVYYFRSFNDWTVICGRDDSTRRDNCTLTAPPPEMHGAESQIEIGEGGAGDIAVTVRVRNTLMPDAPFYLRVDAKPPHQVMPNRFGEGGWSGTEAQAIVDELKSGQRVVVRWFVGPPPSPRDEFLSLNGFDDALADLGGKIARGPLSSAAPTPPPDAAASRPAPSAAAATDANSGTARPQPQPEPPKTEPQPGEPAAPATAASPTGGSGEGVEIVDAAHIGRAQLTSNVVNREPVDEVTPPVQVSGPAGRNELYFFTEITDMAGKTVTHRWEYNGNAVATVPFQIGSARWRVYSRKSLAPGNTGPWTVTATAADGRVLARADFSAE